MADKGSKTIEWRKWKGLNQTDARIAIGDDEFFWNENAFTVGDGAIQILRGPAPPVFTTPTPGGGQIGKISGFTLSGSPVLIVQDELGNVTQVTPAGVPSFFGPGGYSQSSHFTIWQGTPILLIDPGAPGYATWDGALYVTIDATRKGTSIAVFEGRVWIGNGRTLSFTAPNTFNDFVVGDGAGSVIITDEAFGGNIVALISAFEQLWVIGESSIEAISNVQASGVAPNVITTFSITNIATNLGTSLPNSVIGYFRALALLAPYGVYALSGVTPQKLSAKIDSIFDTVQLLPDAPAAVAMIERTLCLLYLVTYTGGNALSGAPTSLILGFKEGQWFVASQNLPSSPHQVQAITSLIVGGIPQAWCTDGFSVYQLFGAAPETPNRYKVQSKLYPLGSSTTEKALLKVGFEYQTALPIHPTVMVDSPTQSEVLSLTPAGVTGTVLTRQLSNMFGPYLGWTIIGTDPPYRIQSIEFEYQETREWNAP